MLQWLKKRLENENFRLWSHSILFNSDYTELKILRGNFGIGKARDWNIMLESNCEVTFHRNASIRIDSDCTVTFESEGIEFLTLRNNIDYCLWRSRLSFFHWDFREGDLYKTQESGVLDLHLNQEESLILYYEKENCVTAYPKPVPGRKFGFFAFL